MKTFLGVLVLALIVGGVFFLVKQGKDNDNQTASTAGSTTEQQPEQQTQTPVPTPTPEPVVVSDHPTATIETTLGTVVVTLDHTAAPKTVENFVKLSNDGFYNGLKFHRVIPNFVIQGGDPSGDGTGGPGYTVPAEIKLTHKKGAIAMARTGDQVNPTRASSGSQFYIVVDENAQTKSLDGQYTVFGYVTSGMDIVTKISNVPTQAGDFPVTDVLIKKITIKE
jgi:cyclophilin family peptidyl-prolyl cis-trans isomerase